MFSSEFSSALGSDPRCSSCCPASSASMFHNLWTQRTDKPSVRWDHPPPPRSPGPPPRSPGPPPHLPLLRVALPYPSCQIILCAGSWNCDSGFSLYAVCCVLLSPRLRWVRPLPLSLLSSLPSLWQDRDNKPCTLIASHDAWLMLPLCLSRIMLHWIKCFRQAVLRGMCTVVEKFPKIIGSNQFPGRSRELMEIGWTLWILSHWWWIPLKAYCDFPSVVFILGACNYLFCGSASIGNEWITWIIACCIMFYTESQQINNALFFDYCLFFNY